MRRELIYDLLPIAILLIVAFAYVAHLMVRPGLISGLDWPFPPEGSHYREYLNGLRYAWTQVGIFTGARSTFLAVVGNWILLGYFLSEVGLSAEVYSKVTLFAAVVVSGVASYFLLRLGRLSKIASVMGGIVYMSSPIFFDWITLTGMSSIASVYVLFPLMFYSFLKSLSKGRQRFIFILIATFSVVGVYPVFGIYLSFLFLSAYSVFAVLLSKAKKETLSLILTSLLPILILSVALQAFWLAVAIQGGETINPGGYDARNWPISSFTLLDVGRLSISYFPAYENVVSSNPVLVATSFIIPAFSYTALLGKKSKLSIFYAIMAISLTLFLASPLSTQLVRDNFLLLGVFRDKSKFLVPVALSYCALFGSAVDSAISALASHRLNVVFTSGNRALFVLKEKDLKVIFILAMLVLATLYGSPYVASLGRSNFGNVSFPGSYAEVARYIQENSADSKALWLPVGGNQIRLAGQDDVAWTNDFYSMFFPSGLTVLSNRHELIPQFWLSNMFYPARSISPPNGGFEQWQYLDGSEIPSYITPGGGDGSIIKNSDIVYDGNYSAQVVVPPGSIGKWYMFQLNETFTKTRCLGVATYVDTSQNEVQISDGRNYIVYSFSTSETSVLKESPNVRVFHRCQDHGWSFYLLDVETDWFDTFGCLPEPVNLFIVVRGEGTGYFDAIQGWGTEPIDYPIAKIAGLFNIQYIIDRRDIEYVNWGTTLDSPIWTRKFDEFSRVLQQSGFQKDVDFGNIAVYKNDFVQPKVFSANSLAVATGGLDVLSILASSEDHVLHSTAITFTSERLDMSIYNISDTIFLDNNGLIDLVLPVLSSSKVIDPGAYGYQSAINGWSRLHQWRWDDPLQEDLEDIALIEDGTGTITMPITITEPNDYTVWAKVLTGREGSTLQFTFWGGPTGFQTTFSVGTCTPEREELSWLRLDNASGNTAFDLQAGSYFLSVTSAQGRNALARIVFAPKSDFEEATTQVASILARKRVIMIEDRDIVNKSIASSSKMGPLTDFQEIDPSTYKVQIVNATEPFFLIFLETYDQEWKLFSGQDKPLDSKHFRAFGYANAWYVNMTGSHELTIRHSLQNALEIGIAISLTTFAICIGYIGLASSIHLLHFLKKRGRNANNDKAEHEK